MEFREVTYTSERWLILKRKRLIAHEIMDCLRRNGLKSIVYGSIARGDVNKQSDVDVFIPYKIPSYQVEYALERKGFQIFDRIIVQATPKYCIKAYINLDSKGLLSVSFPLVKPMRR